MQVIADVVTFTANEAVYGVPVAQVREILDMCPVVTVPNAPTHVLGLIDVREETVAVVDLRSLLGLPPCADTTQTRILLIWAGHGTRRSVVGLRTDRVIEVAALDAPLTGVQGADLLDWSDSAVVGIGRRNGETIRVLNLEQLLAGKDIRETGHAPA